jgi:hypothetical protein
MECILCKKILGNDEKNIVIKHNNENYCVGCYDVIFLFGDINKQQVKKENVEKPVKKIISSYKCPRCKTAYIKSEKNCSKCNLKNPMWR